MSVGAFIVFLLSLCVLIAQGEVYSVIQDKNGNYVLEKSATANYIAIANVDPNPNATGWATLSIETNDAFPDAIQAYAAGFLEGAVTGDLIWNSWISQVDYFYNGQLQKNVISWLLENDDWINKQVKTCQNIDEKSKEYESGDCVYWSQVGLVQTQLQGMTSGYNKYSENNKNLEYVYLLAMNAAADIGDIMAKIDPSSVPTTEHGFMERDHCSVLIKYSPETKQIYQSHTTWGHYVYMLRVFKHYTFNYANVVSKSVSFSSFPAQITSNDDYFITDRGLIVTETTNNVYNMSLYEYVNTQTVLYWIRVVVSNRISDDGPTWVQTFAKYNSGTYNNQWQVTNTKLFTPDQPIVPNTLWILEQIPGFVESADVTSFLINDGYFPSYNVPYFPFIYNISGFAAQYEKYGNEYSYSACPRANIFRRDHGKVHTLEDMQNIMRYNEYQTDPLSLGDPCNGISARCDLNTTIITPFGGYDCKVASTDMIKEMMTTALSGPTTLTQEPFSWTGPFADIPHDGQPTLFNFTFQIMQPTDF